MADSRGIVTVALTDEQAEALLAMVDNNRTGHLNRLADWTIYAAAAADAGEHEAAAQHAAHALDAAHAAEAALRIRAQIAGAIGRAKAEAAR